MKDAILIELADTWDLQAASDKDPANAKGRETLRMCADTLRVMVEAAKPKDCPHAEPPFRYCYQCKVQPCPIGIPQPPARTLP